jgi:hypothetical protein
VEYILSFTREQHGCLGRLATCLACECECEIMSHQMRHRVAVRSSSRPNYSTLVTETVSGVEFVGRGVVQGRSLCNVLNAM